MSKLEKVLIGAIIGPVFPILGFIAAWWGIVLFLPGIPYPLAFAGLLIGILVDVVYLRRWVDRAYSIPVKFWAAVYLFYSLGLLGLFMGVPVFNLTLAVPAGLFMGGRLARQTTDDEQVKRMRRKTCTFTTGVLAAVCAASAAIALVDPYTSHDLQGLLGLPFEITRGMLVCIIAIGGMSLLVLQWVITGKVIDLTYTFMQRNSNR